MENTDPWVLLVAGLLLGWLFGWLMELLFFRKSKGGAQSEQVDALSTQLASCEQQVRDLHAAALNAPAEVTAYEAQITALNGQLARLESEIKRLRAAPVAAAAVGATAAGWGTRGEPDLSLAELPTEPSDLEALEGIGPVMAARLRDAGITNYARLARTTPAWLDDLFRAPAWRRPAYDMWIAQARLADAGDAAGLKVLQDRLYARHGDNLALIFGIGPAGADALRRAGITSFAALAATDPEQLRLIAVETGIRNPDVDSWIREAELRAAGKRIARSPYLRDSATLVACPQDLSRVRGIGSILETRLYAAGIGTFWELAGLSDEELARVLDADSAHGVSLSDIKASARHLATSTGTAGLAWDGTPPDDLEVLAGIGQVYERRLVEGGICTYRALATATEEELDTIIRPQGTTRPDYASWIAQAKALTD